MARNKKSSPIEDLIDVTAMLPWWAGCGLVLVSYLILHRIASQPAPEISPGQITTVVTQTVWKSLASIGQYLLPLLFLVGAAVYAYGRKQRQNLVTKVTGGNAADALDGITWQEFEVLVGEAFRLQGYQVTESGGGGADGGVDLVLRKSGEKFLVQCKQWKAFSVGVAVVRELYGVMAASGAVGGFVVTSGRFTEEAKTFAAGRNVSLVDGPALHALIRKAQTVRGSGDKSPRKAEAAVVSNPVAPPACPFCAKPMVLRTAKRGGTQGSSFWGCSTFPVCRGTRQID